MAAIRLARWGLLRMLLTCLRAVPPLITDRPAISALVQALRDQGSTATHAHACVGSRLRGLTSAWARVRAGVRCIGSTVLGR